MNRNLLIIAGVFLSMIAILLLGNIIVIGDKLGQITHVYIEYAFYAIIIVLAYIYVIHPIVKVHNAPELPVLSIGSNKDVKKLYSFAQQLGRNCDYIKDKDKRSEHSKNFLEEISYESADFNNLKMIITNEINRRIDGDKNLGVLGINERIKEWATSVFMVTAISQSSKIDTIAVLLMNYKMISDIVLASGFRPTKPQMFKIYVRVLTTSLFTYCFSQVFTDNNGVAPFDIADDSALTDVIDHETSDADIVTEEAGLEETIVEKLKESSIVRLLAQSAIQGCLNALMTLRIGYVTKAYLTEGPAALNGINNKRKVKWQARKSALAALPSVIIKGGSVLSEKTYKALNKALNLISNPKDIN